MSLYQLFFSFLNDVDRVTALNYIPSDGKLPTGGTVDVLTFLYRRRFASSSENRRRFGIQM